MDNSLNKSAWHIIQLLKDILIAHNSRSIDSNSIEFIQSLQACEKSTLATDSVDLCINWFQIQTHTRTFVPKLVDFSHWFWWFTTISMRVRMKTNDFYFFFVSPNTTPYRSRRFDLNWHFVMWFIHLALYLAAACTRSSKFDRMHVIMPERAVF